MFAQYSGQGGQLVPAVSVWGVELYRIRLASSDEGSITCRHVLSTLVLIKGIRKGAVFMVKMLNCTFSYI